MSDKYNGWTNRETWATNLWLTNDASTQDFWAEEIQRLRRIAESADGMPAVWTAAEYVRFTLAERLREEFENVWADAMERDGVLTAQTAQCLYDIGSLWRVDWQEIADSMLS